MVPVLLCRQRSCTHKPTCDYEDCLSSKILVEIGMGERIGPQHVDLATQVTPSCKIYVSCLALEEVLNLFAFFNAFGYEILAEFERSMEKVDVRETTKAQ